MRKLQAERREIEDRHDPLLKAARQKSQDDHQRALADLFHERDEVNDSIAELRHGRMIDLAERYGVVVSPRTPPKPQADGVMMQPRKTEEEARRHDAWERSSFTGRWFISKSEVARLRSAIRQEKKERFEEWSRWLPPLVSVLSLAVVILALVLKH